MDTEKAYLSNDKDMIKFQYGRRTSRLRGPYSLEYFTAVKEWDNGYMVVMAKYQHNQEPEEAVSCTHLSMAPPTAMAEPKSG